MSRRLIFEARLQQAFVIAIGYARYSGLLLVLGPVHLSLRLGY